MPGTRPPPNPATDSDPAGHASAKSGQPDIRVAVHALKLAGGGVGSTGFGAPASCSPDTVASKLRRCASDGIFNTFFGEFNFGNLPEDYLLRSINLFGREVIPALRDFEPF